MAASELNAYKFSSPQSVQQVNPTTVASAANIVPTQKMTFITGTVSLETIGTINADTTVTPVQEGYHELVFVFTNAAPGVFVTTGNIQRAAQAIQNVPFTLFYDPNTKKYWVGAPKA